MGSILFVQLPLCAHELPQRVCVDVVSGNELAVIMTVIAFHFQRILHPLLQKQGTSLSQGKSQSSAWRSRRAVKLKWGSVHLASHQSPPGTARQPFTSSLTTRSLSAVAELCPYHSRVTKTIAESLVLPQPHIASLAAGVLTVDQRGGSTNPDHQLLSFASALQGGGPLRQTGASPCLTARGSTADGAGALCVAWRCSYASLAEQERAELLPGKPSESAGRSSALQLDHSSVL